MFTTLRVRKINGLTFAGKTYSAKAATYAIYDEGKGYLSQNGKRPFVASNSLLVQSINYRVWERNKHVFIMPDQEKGA